jgi:hypothetical protein
MDQQKRIGWRHFVRGQVARKWSGIIADHIEEQELKGTSKQWCVQLIRTNWKNVLKLWAQRNEDIHGTTPEQKEIKKKNSMIEELQGIQQNSQDISDSKNIDSNRFNKDEENVQQQFRNITLRSKNNSKGKPNK